MKRNSRKFWDEVDRAGPFRALKILELSMRESEEMPVNEVAARIVRWCAARLEEIAALRFDASSDVALEDGCKSVERVLIELKTDAQTFCATKRKHKKAIRKA